MKIYSKQESVVDWALCKIAEDGGAEIVDSAEDADKVLTIDVSEALNFLLSGRKVILFVTELHHDKEGARGLVQNERLKESLTIFWIHFDDNDGEEMNRFISHCAGW